MVEIAPLDSCGKLMPEQLLLPLLGFSRWTWEPERYQTGRSKSKASEGASQSVPLTNLWAEFGDHLRASMMVYPTGFLSFEDKSRAINGDGVDNQLADLINKWHKPGVNLCVGKPEYKTIIESVLKIPCMCCQTVLEIMWGIQQQMCTLVPREKSKLTKEDRLPTSQGLMKFLSNCGFDVKPEMVNEKIFLAACALFHCDADDEKNLGLLRDAGLHIRDISGIVCEDWDILKLAIAVKVICCPKELTDFHEVLAEDVVSKLKGDAPKYKGVAVKDAAKGKRKRSFRFRAFRLQTGSLASDYARTPVFCQRDFRHAAVRADSSVENGRPEDAARAWWLSTLAFLFHVPATTRPPLWGRVTQTWAPWCSRVGSAERACERSDLRRHYSRQGHGHITMEEEQT
ncbi:hypothetical protein C2845_PM15G11630 [Panicum miliaceum]|uniref:Uncharacterized protein n=1 Tax=Panicum miliaceum TaxID=4540 RepID=A0A3L6Q392_PANMI|nr:hypothetical protein C2845_PM15G11630 [Panicum miliaceum]